MGPDDISNPHDHFFKEVFSREDVGRGFILTCLPSGITDRTGPGTEIRT